MASLPEQRTGAFIEWLVSNGGSVNPSVKLADHPGAGIGRGVFAIDDIAEDEVLFTIPRSAVLTTENSDLKFKMLSGDSTKDKVQAAFESPWLGLIVTMIYEFLRGAESRWKPYFDVLPDEFNSLMFWSEEELEELMGSAVLGKIGREITDAGFRGSLTPIIKDFPELFRSTAGLESLLSDDAIIALAHRMGSTIMAYGFDLEKVTGEENEGENEGDDEGFVSDNEDVTMPKGMVPLADMLNADADRNNARLFQTELGLEMRSTKPVRKGEELFNDYGPLPRSDLLRRYGYITDNYAQFDVVELDFQKIVDIAGDHLQPGELDARIQILEAEGVYDSAYDLSHKTLLSSAFPDELLILVNLLLLPQTPRKLPKPKRNSQTITVLQRILAARLEEYPTKLDDDEMLLQDVGLAPRKRLAVQVRLGEKQVLREAWLETLGDGVREEVGDNVMDVDPQGWRMKRGAEDLDIERGGMKGWEEKRRKTNDEL
ncbi:MAG: hypothetical protein M1840_004846 [Geoglossum simile]|nr:MAG: hypothetical protein M1840_004846 [Geoglossum simile]